MKRLQQLFDEVKAFTDDKTPNATPIHRCVKLTEESHEVTYAMVDYLKYGLSATKDGLKRELADIAILLARIAQDSGMNAEELIDIAFTKLAVNNKRDWAEIGRGNYKHIEKKD